MMVTLGQQLEKMGKKIDIASAEMPELNRLREIIFNHRVDVIIRWVKEGASRDDIKKYMEIDPDSYSICKPEECTAGQSCCHKFRKGGITFCSPY